jgi:hypothetical protein
LAPGKGRLQAALGIVGQEQLANAAPGIAKHSIDGMDAKNETVPAATWSLLTCNTVPGQGSRSGSHGLGFNPGAAVVIARRVGH